MVVMMRREPPAIGFTRYSSSKGLQVVTIDGVTPIKNPTNGAICDYKAPLEMTDAELSISLRPILRVAICCFRRTKTGIQYRPIMG